ncbi:IPExxxVDY family protein [Apibacter raozihei]|uniref:IPExxxVDY family protein n=1 Tax=Apibacter TaxID=1778601 RepID=UPI000FE2E1AE|nr:MULTISPECIES: IPExxxVDY family protein [Apibacter]
MKIYSFDWDDDDPIFDFKLLGLASNLIKDYDLAFYLNKYCQFSFKREADQEILNGDVLYLFSVYRFFHSKTKQFVELISNYSYPQMLKGEKYSLFEETESIHILIPEFKRFNYFLKSSLGLNEDFYVNLAELKNIQEYQDIDINTIKINNLENLILPT